MRLLRGPRRLYDEWDRNYRLRGGLPGLAMGLASALRLSLQPTEPTREQARDLEIVSFSVVPELTRLWVGALLTTLPDRGVKVIIGDCSGGLRSLANLDRRLRIIPIYNHAHGVKLDLFMARVCQAPTVVVSDDDIFWLSRHPLSWAREALASRPKLAVVSLYPRGAPKPVLAGKVTQPMGSFCLVIRRSTWIREGLSFRSRDISGTGDYDWTYDTADLAHQTLLERGYEVTIAPPEVRAELVSLEGVSTWALKLQKHRGDMSQLLRTGLRLRKAYRVFRFLADLQADGPSDGPDNNASDNIASVSHSRTLPADANRRELVPTPWLTRAIGWCRDQMPPDEMGEIDSEVRSLIARLREQLVNLETPAATQTHEAAYRG